jgi:hypothetical protein
VSAGWLRNYSIEVRVELARARSFGRDAGSLAR